MTERIGIQFTHLVGPLVSLFLGEAETESYPYAVYDYDVNPVYSKDGVDGLSSELTCVVVSNDYDEAQNIADAIVETLASDMQTDEFFAYLRNTGSSCEEGIWTINLEYNIKQSK